MKNVSIFDEKEFKEYMKKEEMKLINKSCKKCKYKSNDKNGYMGCKNILCFEIIMITLAVKYATRNIRKTIEDAK